MRQYIYTFYTFGNLKRRFYNKIEMLKGVIDIVH
jgi:hypothetical protein